MNVVPNIGQETAAMSQPKARAGLIIPSVNTYSEPQFNHFAPEGLGIHVARARVAGDSAIRRPIVCWTRVSSTTSTAPFAPASAGAAGTGGASGGPGAGGSPLGDRAPGAASTSALTILPPGPV